MSVEYNFRAVVGMGAAASPGTSTPAASVWQFPNSQTTKTGDYVLTKADGTVRFDASARSINATLPDAATCYSSGVGQVFCIKKEDASTNSVNVLTSSPTQMIDGFNSMVIALQYDSLTVQSNGAGWDIISSN